MEADHAEREARRAA
ncbi:hypothetical protein [Amycolatopsis magusensis]